MTEDLLPSVGNFHMAAFARAFSSRLGREYVHGFFRWFVRTERAIALVATREHPDVVGYVIGAPLGYAPVINRGLVWVGLKSLILKPRLLFDSQMLAGLRSRVRLAFGDTHANDGGCRCR